jgi:hypothetical protein
MKVTFTKEELESIIVEHNDKEDDINKAPHLKTRNQAGVCKVSCSDSHGKPHLNSGVIIH